MLVIHVQIFENHWDFHFRVHYHQTHELIPPQWSMQVPRQLETCIWFTWMTNQAWLFTWKLNYGFCLSSWLGIVDMLCLPRCQLQCNKIWLKANPCFWLKANNFFSQFLLVLQFFWRDHIVRYVNHLFAKGVCKSFALLIFSRLLYPHINRQMEDLNFWPKTTFLYCFWYYSCTALAADYC